MAKIFNIADYMTDNEEDDTIEFEKAIIKAE